MHIAVCQNLGWDLKLEFVCWKMFSWKWIMPPNDITNVSRCVPFYTTVRCVTSLRFCDGKEYSDIHVLRCIFIVLVLVFFIFLFIIDLLGLGIYLAFFLIQIPHTHYLSYVVFLLFPFFFCHVHHLPFFSQSISASLCLMPTSKLSFFLYI